MRSLILSLSLVVFLLAFCSLRSSPGVVAKPYDDDLTPAQRFARESPLTTPKRVHRSNNVDDLDRHKYAAFSEEAPLQHAFALNGALESGSEVDRDDVDSLGMTGEDKVDGLEYHGYQENESS